MRQHLSTHSGNTVPMAGRWVLGPLIQQLREPMSQAELGRRIGVTRERMGQIERGRVPWPAPDLFNALARELGVPVTTLLRAGGADIPDDSTSEELAWIISQLDDSGRELLADVGHGLLRRRLRRDGTGDSPLPTPNGEADRPLPPAPSQS